MPANRCDGPSWDPKPDFVSHYQLEPALDSRVFDMYSEADVAECLLETSADIDVYRWDLSNEQLEQMALESARMIIATRRELHITRQLASEFEQAKARRDAREKETNQPKTAVVVGYRQNLETGETTFYDSEVAVGRVYG